MNRSEDTSGPPASAPEVLPPTASVPCVGCGYELRGLASDALCPECARPVRLSRALVAGEIAAGRIEELVGALRTAYFTALAWTLLTAGSQFIAFFASAILPSAGPVALAVVLSGCAGLGWWFAGAMRRLATAADGLGASDDLAPKLARAVWTAWVLAGIATLLAIFFIVRAIPSPAIAEVLKPSEVWLRRAWTIAFLVLLGVHVHAMAPVLSYFVRQAENLKIIELLRTLTKVLPWIIGAMIVHIVISASGWKGIPYIHLLGLAFWGCVFVIFRYLKCLRRTAGELRRRGEGDLTKSVIG